jgi:lauroyl/myristoyl acyltransferase
MRTEKLVAKARAKVPTKALPTLVAARTRIGWSRESVREDARAQMRFLLEHSRPDVDLEAVARSYVAYQARRGELRWHPELITSLRVEGVEHLSAAQALGRGVVLSFIHHGIYEGALASVAGLGFPSQMVVYPYMLEPDAPLWLQQHVRVATSNGGAPVSSAIGADGLADLLGRGEIVAIASDVPGRTPIKLVGREVLGSFGAARLPMATGSPVVVMTSGEEGVVTLHEPLLPGDHETAQSLLEAILGRHEEALLRRPEAYDLPLSRWGLDG